VLTAYHVVAGGEEGGRVVARAVRPGEQTAPWTRMRIACSVPAWDLALLSVDSESSGSCGWSAPRSSTFVVVALSTSAERDCEAVGFPDSAVQHAPVGTPSARVRQSESAVGWVLPAGQAKPPTRPDRPLPPRWLPFDVETAPPSDQAGWGGMSGAGVVLPDGRFIGVVVAAERAHELRRLYLVPLATACAQVPEFALSLDRVAEDGVAYEARDAPVYRAVVSPRSLGPDGLPLRLGELEDLGVLGVKPADVPGEPTYLNYVHRARDPALEQALHAAIVARRMLLVVGASGAGKSRSAAEATRSLLPRHRLLLPEPGQLRTVLELPAVKSEDCVVWLDDVQRYAHAALAQTLERLLTAEVVVVGTIRRAELDRLKPTGDIRDPAGEALTNERLVWAEDWPLEWTAEDLRGLRPRIGYQPLLRAVEEGFSLGVYCVAGPLLTEKLKAGEHDDEHPHYAALMHTVLDWYRTGIGQPIPLSDARELMGLVADGDEGLDDEDFEGAVDWATTPVLGSGRKTRQALLQLNAGAKTLALHDFVRDEDDRRGARLIPQSTWAAALDRASDEGALAIASTAYDLDEHEVAELAVRRLADAGNAVGMLNLGVLLRSSDPEEARRWWERAAAKDARSLRDIGFALKDTYPDEARAWYERAAEVGDAAAMNDLAILLEDTEPGTAVSWWKRAAAAGSLDAMANLGGRLAVSDPDAAATWYRSAAEAGHTGAMNNLGVLLSTTDPDAAREWFTRASEAGQANAAFNVGALLVERDPEAARQWFRRAADAGHAQAMNNLGSLLVESNPDEARLWLERAANAGNLEAMNNLGAVLAATDHDAARSWFERAAEAGSVDAMAPLAALLRETDPETARHWLERAATGGDAQAMFLIGETLLADDDGSAHRWLERAAEAGNTDAILRLGELALENDRAIARDWFERGAAAGDARAMNNLGMLAVGQDQATARNWFERAAVEGSVVAMRNLGLMIQEDDPAAARSWLERAALAGDTEASFRRGTWALDAGEHDRARCWFERAAKAGDPRAMNNLAILLIGHDRESAKRWFQQAADAGYQEAARHLDTLGEDDDSRRAHDLLFSAVEHRTHDRLDEALAADRDALSLYRELARIDADEYDPPLAFCLVELAMTLSSLGRRDDAVAANSEAIEIYRRLGDTEPGGANAEDYAAALSYLAVCLNALGNWSAALLPAMEAVELHRRLTELDPAGHRRSLSVALSGLHSAMEPLSGSALDPGDAVTGHLAAASAAAARALRVLEEPLQAVAAESQSVDIYRRLADADPGTFRPHLAQELFYLALDQMDLGDSDGAVATNREAVRVTRELVPLGPDYEGSLAAALGNLAVSCYSARRWDEALSAARESVELWEPLTRAGVTGSGDALREAMDTLASFLDERGQHDEAQVWRMRARALDSTDS
jgi:TPR repeat protein